MVAAAVAAADVAVVGWVACEQAGLVDLFYCGEDCTIQSPARRMDSV